MRDIEDYQAKYLENESYEEFQVKHRKQCVLPMIKQYNAKRLLEIGVGMDPIFNYLESFDDYTVVEPGNQFAEVARNFARQHSCSGDINIIEDYFEKVAHKLNSGFDFVMCIGLLHELSNQKEVVEAIVKVCDENTIVHINVPNANSLHRILAVRVGLINSVYEKSDLQIRLQQHNIFSMEILTELVESCGLRVIEHGTISLKPFSHAQMLELIEKGILSVETLDALANMTDLFPNYGSEMYINAILKTG